MDMSLSDTLTSILFVGLIIMLIRGDRQRRRGRSQHTSAYGGDGGVAGDGGCDGGGDCGGGGD
jgi:hypothetical protein